MIMITATMRHHHKKSDGFIVLTTVIILSVLLLLLAQTLSTAGYFQRRGILDFQFRELSYFSALSCLDRAIYKLSYDLDYTGNEVFQLGPYQCSVLSITYAQTITTIHTSATVDRSTTKLVGTADINLTLISTLEE